MKLSKQTAKDLGQLINCLLVYQNMVDRALAKNNGEDAIRAMQAFNARADELVQLGVPVTKYGI